MKTRRLPAQLALFGLAAILVAGLQAPVIADGFFSRPASSALGQQEPRFLTADDAFQLDAWHDNEELTLAWRIAEGYYLYQHRFQVIQEPTENGKIAPVAFPAGIDKVDEYFGEITAYYNQLELSVSLDPNQPALDRTFRVTFQGCADAGLCYPPQKKLLTLGADGSVNVAKISRTD